MAGQNEQPPVPNLMEHLSNELEGFLINAGVYEDDEMKSNRFNVFRQLSAIVKRWIQSVIKESHRNDWLRSVETFAFGSYSLDVHGPGGDIDVLCVAPNYLRREIHFFQTLHDMLKNTPQVTELITISGAKVPIMKFKFDGIPIDLSNAILPTNSGIDKNLYAWYMDNRRAMLESDQRSVHSLNGYINMEIIKIFVGENIENYLKAVRFLKLWAKRRGIYSNVVGYFGGINLLLLLCLVNLRFPKALPSELVLRFFAIFSQWHWPSPVKLRKMELINELQLKNWNPVINSQIKLDLMPTITPAFPSINAAYNVSLSSCAILKEEIQNGHIICQDIIAQKKDWNALLEGPSFFSAYKNYFQIELRANTADDLRTWKGWIESRLRRLIEKIDQKTELKLHAHLHPRDFMNPSDPETHGHQCYFYMAFRRNKKMPIRAGHDFDLTQLMIDFRYTVSLRYYTWKEENMQIYIKYITASDIPDFVIKSDRTVKRKCNAGLAKPAKPAKRAFVSPIPSPTKNP